MTRADLIAKVYFPRIFIPLTPVLAGLVDFAIALSLVAVLMVYYHYPPTMALVYFPLLVGVMILTAAGIGLWLSALAIQFRDVKFADPVRRPVHDVRRPGGVARLLIPGQVPAALRPIPHGGRDRGFRSSPLGKIAHAVGPRWDGDPLSVASLRLRRALLPPDGALLRGCRLWAEAMAKPAIRVDDLTKLYRLGLKEQRHETLGGATSISSARP